MHSADTVVVTLVPQSGDVVQAMKAGLMEIADVFCLNKSDQPGAGLAEQSLQQLLSLSMRAWTPPIVPTVAVRGEGIEALRAAVLEHQTHLGTAGQAQRRQQRLESTLKQGAESRWRHAVWNAEGQALLTRLARDVAQKKRAPFEAVERLLQAMGS